MPKITGQSTMAQVLQTYPSAQRALFQKYHIGGCSSCGFEPDDTLQSVLEEHGAAPDEVARAVAYIEESAEVDRRLQKTPAEVRDLLKSNPRARLLDVRPEWEARMASISGATLLTPELAQEIMAKWDKSAPIVFHCHHGIRSLDAASYFAGHGFANACSMAGGVDAWSEQIDPTVPRY